MISPLQQLKDREVEFNAGEAFYQRHLELEIVKKIISLDDEDATGHIYWNQFLELVKNFKP
jgi:hypothetical protein